MSDTESSTLGDEQQPDGEASSEPSSARLSKEGYEPPRVKALGTLPASTGMSFSLPGAPDR
jgi:hypothetical protein